MMKSKMFSAKNFSIFGLWLAVLAPYLAYASDPRGMATGLFALLGLGPLAFTNILMLVVAYILRREGVRWLRLSFLSIFLIGWALVGLVVAHDFRGNELPTLNVLILVAAFLFVSANVWGMWINRKVRPPFSLRLRHSGFQRLKV